MSRQSKISREVAVQLSTAAGVVFSATAQGVALRGAHGTIDVTGQGDSYLSLIGKAELEVRIGEITRVFEIVNATAGIKAGRLAILAETFREIALRTS